MDGKRLLILDIDQTLVYVADDPYDVDTPSDFQFYADDDRCYYGWKRPGLDRFLTWCFANYTIGVWSAADADYVDGVLSNILPVGCHPTFVWSRDRCSNKRIMDGLHVSEVVTVKNLRKVFRRKISGHRYRRSDVLILDDTSTTYLMNFGNALPIDQYSGGIEDVELARITDALENLKTKSDVRKVEKRKGKKLYLQ